MPKTSSLCALALLALVCETAIVKLPATSSTVTEERKMQEVAIESPIQWKPSEIIHSKRFFHAEHCTVDDGLIIAFRRGDVSVNVKDRALRGVNLTPTEMRFRVGDASCEILVRIERYASN